MRSRRAPARALIEAGVPVAVASDANPGTCYTESLPAVAVHACLDSGLSVEETLTGMTLNAAASLGLAGEIGSLEPGKWADLLILDAPDDRHLIYHWGVQPGGPRDRAGPVDRKQTAVTDFSKLSLEQFLAALASDAPTPGGGTAAAVAGAMGAALAEMVAQLTLSKEKYASAHDAVRPIAEAGQLARAEFLNLAREDSEAYDRVVAARRLPKDTEAEKAARAAADRRSPAGTPPRCRCARPRPPSGCSRPSPSSPRRATPTPSRTSGAAALLLDACVEGALLNVGINLAGIEDATFVAEMQRETAVLQEESQRLRSQVVALVRKRF